MELEQQPGTGEIFVMRSPHLLFDHTNVAGWESLQQAIEHCGGRVITLPDNHNYATKERLVRDPMYTRDPPIATVWAKKPVLLGGEENPAFLQQEYNYAGWELEAGGLTHREKLPGAIEGGNAVYDAARRILFVGMNNQNQQIKAPTFYGKDTSEHDEPQTDQQKKAVFYSRVENAQKNDRWVEAAKSRFAQDDMRSTGGEAVRVVKLFMPDEALHPFYHLDGAFNMLPSGQAVVCRNAFSKAANHQIDRILGRENIFELSPMEAKNLATNFITVGKNVLTPYAPPALKAWFEGLGYEVVDPPSLGLPERAWNFGPGAGPRCATLKLTPDMGYPPHTPSRAPVK